MITFWWCVATTWYSYWLSSPIVLIVVQQIRTCLHVFAVLKVSGQTDKWQTCHVCLMALNLMCLPCIDRSHWSFVLEIIALLEVLHRRRENGSPDCWKTWLRLDPFMDLPDEFLLYLQFLSPTFECVYSWPLEQQFDNDWAKDDKPDVESFNFVQDSSRLDSWNELVRTPLVRFVK